MHEREREKEKGETESNNFVLVIFTCKQRTTSTFKKKKGYIHTNHKLKYQKKIPFGWGMRALFIYNFPLLFMRLFNTQCFERKRQQKKNTQKLTSFFFLYVVTQFGRVNFLQFIHTYTHTHLQHKQQMSHQEEHSHIHQVNHQYRHIPHFNKKPKTKNKKKYHELIQPFFFLNEPTTFQRISNPVYLPVWGQVRKKNQAVKLKKQNFFFFLLLLPRVDDHGEERKHHSG